MTFTKTHLCLSSALISALYLSPTALAQSNSEIAADPFNGLDIITVTGTRTSPDDVTGSVSFIGPEDLELQSYGDLNRVLRAAPGVNLQEEDGYGLRPNIGLRGSGSDRSSKVLIMEDGVLMAPAPYSAPSAYYIPMTGRMNAVEITKGPATVKYGPNTTAGAIQFFSTPIPQEASAKAEVLVSDLGRVKAHGWAGNRFDLGGFSAEFLVETYQDHADGFKDLDNGGDTGFDIEDYVVKLGLASNDDRHSLEFKFQYKDEVSNETYLGLTQSDFNATPDRRYNASSLDKMVNDHTTYQLTHNLALSENWQLTNIAYRTEFARNWRKLDRFDNSSLSGNSSCSRLNNILRNETLCSAELNVLRGPAGYISPDDALQLRANNRSYYAQGIQSALGGNLDFGGVTHNLVLSARYHKDEVDRFQDQDDYRIDNQTLVLTTDNAPGTQANRLSDAKALSLFAEDRIELDRLTVTAGLRLEDVSSKQLRWSSPSRAAAPSSERDNDYTVWLPALSAQYDVSETLSVLGGVHKGFAAAPVSSRQSTSPEKSVVYEGGMRYRGENGLKVDAIAFFNDYSNLLGECTNSTGGSNCDIGDAFNAGSVDVRGLEFTASYDFGRAMNSDLNIPVSLSYTHTDTKLKSTFDDSFWGSVTAGDALPYVPSHQFTLSAGLRGDVWGIDGIVNTVSKTRNTAGQGTIPLAEKIEGRLLVDMSAHYDLSDNITLKIKAENLFDKDYVAARRPYGLRPGKPREIFGGIALKF
ncbi:MAG: TonB-dependent receptor family protein [Maricaulaceae bacterium]